MTKLVFSILSLFLIQHSLVAFNGEKRLSKKNIIAIHSDTNGSLLLNDLNGNIFNYNGDQINKVKFENDIDTPTVVHSQNDDIKIFSRANSLYIKNKKTTKEILSVAQFETILSTVENQNFFFVSTSNALYQIGKNTGEVLSLIANNIEKTNNLLCANNDCFVAMKNLIINLSNDKMVEHKLPSAISSLTFHPEHGFISLCEGKIFISSKDGSKKLFPSIGEIPSDIIDICGSDRWLYLISGNSVSVFDWINSEVKYLGEFNGFHASKHIDKWDNLWLSTNQGLWNFSAYSSFDSPKIVGIYVTDKNNKVLDVNPLKFIKGTDMVNVTPQIVYLPNTDRLINEWRLEDGSWRSFVKDFALSENMLSDGKNNLYIRSKSKDSDFSLPFKLSIENSVNASNIPVLWYAALGLIASLLVVSFISLFSLRDRQNKDKLQIEKLKAENALLQSKQQIDQLKMNPHFIFNALNSINGLIATGKSSESRKAISLFSKFLRQFLYQSQEESIILEDEINLIQNYVKIEQVCRAGKFEFTIDVDDSLLDVNVPNMIIQPFIENAILHAFPSKEDAGIIKLIIKQEEGYLVASVIDNGIGLKNSVQKKDHKSVAVNLVRKRLAQRDKNRRKNYLQYLENKPGTIAKIFLQRL